MYFFLTLIKCPFCGGDGFLESGLRDGYTIKDEVDAYWAHVRCRSCACHGPGEKGDTPDDARRRAEKRWNTRITPEPKRILPDETLSGDAQEIRIIDGLEYTFVSPDMYIKIVTSLL